MNTATIMDIAWEGRRCAVIESLDPGVRRLVTLLRERGFNTTDSGDGVSKPSDERSMDVPHVAILCPSPSAAIGIVGRVVDVLRDAGVDFDPPCDCCGLAPRCHVQMSWSPLDDVAIVMVTGVRDTDLGDAP